MRLVSLALALVAGIAVLTAVAPSFNAQSVSPVQPPQPSPEVPVSHGGPVRDYVSLVDALRAAGATVEPVGEVTQPFFAVSGWMIRVNDGDVQVFEYEDEVAAEADATRVSPDGSAIGTTSILWVGSPHFFRTGRLIALYVGDEPNVLDLLQSVLGPQFAGQ